MLEFCYGVIEKRNFHPPTQETTALPVEKCVNA
jgi:hypothetical protein